MKGIKPLIFLIIVILVVVFLVPADIRNGYFFYGLGRFYELTGDQGAAASNFEEASVEMPDNAGFAAAYARALNDIAVKFDDEDQFRKAQDFAEDWIEEHPNHSNAYLLYIERARAEWGREREINARRSIDKAVELNPTSYEALVYQGIIHRDINPNNRNAVSKAIQIFEQAIEVRNYRNTEWAHYELAVAWDMVGNEGKALNAIEQSLSQFPPRELREKAERLKNKISSGGRSEK